MDIYGYNAYQCNRPDELNNQMYPQQALAMPYPRPVPEGHSMPVPQETPWNVQGLPWGLQSPPQLVQFTGGTEQIPPVIHCKRKSLDTVSEIPSKQFITEEKMAAHMNGLHISSNYKPHSFAAFDGMDMGLELPSTSSSYKSKGPKVVLSEEIKKLQQEPLLPPSILERLEKPCMSLVVWKPKEKIIDPKLKAIEEKDKKEEQNQIKRNGVLVPELSMDVEM